MPKDGKRKRKGDGLDRERQTAMPFLYYFMPGAGGRNGLAGGLRCTDLTHRLRTGRLEHTGDPAANKPPTQVGDHRMQHQAVKQHG